VETCQRLCIHVDDCPVAHGTEEPQHGD
jgi:hypothetical protein